MKPEYLHPSSPEEACNFVRELQSVVFTAGKCLWQESEYMIDLREFDELLVVEYEEKTGGKIGAALFFEEWERCAVLEDIYPGLYRVMAEYGRDEKLKRRTLGEAVACREPAITEALEQYHAKIQIQDADHWYRIDVVRPDREAESGIMWPDIIQPDKIQSDEIITCIMLPPVNIRQALQ